MARNAPENENDAAGSTDSTLKKTDARGKDGKKGERRVTKEAYNFPKCSLEECVRVAQAIEEKNAGKLIPAGELVKLVGFHQANDWRFLDLLRSANMFGVIDGVGETATVALTKIGEDIVAPSSSDQRRQALRKAFETVEVFKGVADYYAGKKIPEDEYFSNTLVREFHIPRERVEKFIDVFTKSLNYLTSFGDAPFTVQKEQKGEKSVRLSAPTAAPSHGVLLKDRQREFLDTCFVLMPFGGWYDTYYKDVYCGAIKAAGFEPFRADDLFHSGSVMEQIWEQICDSKVLLAEVTGKNANVFYELGLAHSRGQPVVILTGNLDDVPFDLRHLRVVVYDVRDPAWAEKVRASVTTHLRNAKIDPARSIPQPFRAIAAAANNDDEHQTTSHPLPTKEMEIKDLTQQVASTGA